MKIVRTTLSTLVAALMVLLAACSQAPAPQATPEVEEDLTSQALTGGTVVGWGDNNYGQVNIPAGLTNVTAISAGRYHSLALKNDGTLVVWGWNDYGQVNMPAGLSDVVAISAGGFHSLALKADGTVVGWGDNNYGQVNIPTGLSDVTAIAASGFHSLALKADGTLVSWGDNNYGQVNIPTGLSDVTAIAAGGFHSLALKRDGTAPSVSVEQAADQTDPSSADTITFTATFSEDVTGFDGSDVTLSGTAGATTATVSGGPSTYTIQVSGMTTYGTVIASIAAGVATDAAGNLNTASTSSDNEVSYVDTTPPTASPSISDKYGNALQANAAGWYNKTVTVTWNWSDEAGGSGIDTANCETLPTSVSHGRVTLSTTCTDVAGNQGSASLVVKVDTVAPSISYVGAAPASPNAQGWYNTNVTVSFAGTDATSGIASCPTKMVSEGFGKTATGVCTDNAGNRKTLVSPAFNIDKTKPVVNVLMNGSVVSGTTPSYSLAQGIPTASCETTDALSGVATSASLSLVKVTSSGEVAAANPPTTTGTYRAKCLGALDNADNANARTVSFKVTR
jgi:hypothetical protein